MRLDQIEPGDSGAVATLGGPRRRSSARPPFAASRDFYLTNPIARASAVMAECARQASGSMLVAAE